MSAALAPIDARSLLYTERGRAWLDQFKASDREAAERVLRSLTLVSHSAFERAMHRLIEHEVETQTGPVAFYAIREVDPSVSLFSQAGDPQTGAFNALSTGKNHGSEARIAALIRNVAKTAPKHILNHPTIEELRSARCKAIYLVDDFIGSGERATEYLRAMRQDKTFEAWCSLKYVRPTILAYSGTEKGLARVRRAKRVADIIVERACPTYSSMPWGRKQEAEVCDILSRYGRQTSSGYFWDGYGSAMAALVFEHGCPDNCPAVLWASDEPRKPWKPLFPKRVVLSPEQSIFPPEVARRDSTSVLLDVGQRKLATSGALSRRGEWGRQTLVVLALVAKGQRRQAAIGFATGLSAEEVARLLDKCAKWGYLTRARRITARGRAELDAARRSRKMSETPARGEEDYYPRKLRRATRG